MKHADDGLVIPHSDAATAAPRDALITRPLMLILVVGALRGFEKETAPEPDHRALGEYVFLIAALSALTLIRTNG